jgi:hypothetical protein
MNPDNNSTQNKDNQTTSVTELFLHTFCFLPPFLFLSKPVTHVCTLKMAKDELSAYFASSYSMSQAM